MTYELEKQFFDTFGIEAKSKFTCKREYYSEVCTQPTCNGCSESIKEEVYPQITDRKLLELYCIVSDYCVITADSITELKEKILKDCIRLDVVKVDIKHQVRTLFEEGLNDR